MVEGREQFGWKDKPEVPFLCIGEVIDNKDPDGVGKVKVSIGYLTGGRPLPVWAYPLGSIFGGNPQRGLFAVPEKGSTIAVFFEMGNLQRPYYMGGPWAKPNGVSEVPTAAQGQVDPSKKLVWETGKWQIIWDDNPTGEFEIKRKVGNGKLVFKDDGTVVVDGTKIELSEGATEAVLKGDAFKVVYDLHGHLETGGTTGGPTVPLPANTLSTKARVGG